jgi:hypothetical protein
MALQLSGAISLSEVQVEFGGENPISMSEYYGVDSGVPASGSISLSQFYGASSAETVWAMRDGSIGVTLASTDISTGDAYAGIDLRGVMTNAGLVLYASTGGGTSTKYSNSGVSSSLSSESKVFDSTHSGNEVKLDWNISISTQSGVVSAGATTDESPAATYNATDNTYRQLSNNESIGIRFYAQSSISPPSFITANVTVNVWVRDGVNEVNVGTVLISLQATSEDFDEGGL